MNAKDISKKFGISRKWLDNFSKEKHEELGDAHKFLDWDKYLPEIKEKWAKRPHKEFDRKPYIKLTKDYRTVGYYKPEDLEIIKSYTELYTHIDSYYLDVFELRFDILEEYADMCDINGEKLKTLSEFFLKELAHQDCLYNDYSLESMNRSIKSLRGFKNKLTLDEMKKCIAEKKYPSGKKYEYGRRILEIRKELHNEVDDKKRTKSSYYDNFNIYNIDFNYKDPQSFIETLKQLHGKKEIEGFYNSFLDFLKLKYGLLHRDFELLSKDYKNCNLTELKKEIEKKINEKNDSIELSFKELSHAYDDFRPKQEILGKQLKEINHTLKGYRQDIKNKRTKIQNKTTEKRDAFKIKSEIKNALDKRKAEIHSLTPKGKRVHISDDPIVIDIMKKRKLAIAEHKSRVNEEKLLVDEKNDIKNEKERSADNKKDIKERNDLLDLEKDKTLYLRKNIDFLLKELNGYKKTLEEIDLIMEKNKELKRFKIMIKELDSSWSYNSQDYKETIDLLANKENESKKEFKLSEEDYRELFKKNGYDLGFSDEDFKEFNRSLGD